MLLEVGYLVRPGIERSRMTVCRKIDGERFRMRERTLDLVKS